MTLIARMMLGMNCTKLTPSDSSCGGRAAWRISLRGLRQKKPLQDYCKLLSRSSTAAFEYEIEHSECRCHDFGLLDSGFKD